MANDDLIYKIGAEADLPSAETAGEKLGKGVQKGVAKATGSKNGYVKLTAEITDFKYPKQTKQKNGLTMGIDYSELQKAQDELISKWNKLSKKGFFSDDEKVLDMLKSYRNYQQTVKRQYGGNTRQEDKDLQLGKIKRTIGTQIYRYFTRVMGNVPTGSGHNGFFTSAETNGLFEKYAKDAIKKAKAANALGIDLSDDTPFTKETRAKVSAKQRELEEQEKAKMALKQRKYEAENAEKIKKAQDEELKQIEKNRKELKKKSVAIPKSDIPLEDIALSTTEVKNLAEPTGYKQSLKDLIKDEQFIDGLNREAFARKYNTPTNEINLGRRAQVWDPTYLTKDLLNKMEHGGTYVDSNSLLRQTMAAIPEEIKKSIKSLVTTINKDEAAKVFNRFDASDKKQFSDIRNQTGMSSLLLKNVAKVQNGLMAGRPDVTADDLKKAITVALADAVEHGKSEIAAENYNKGVISIVNMLMARYDNMKDFLGGTYR